MLQTEASEITYLFRDAQLQVPLRLCFLESGLVTWARATHFDHPVPPFNRVFLFRTGGCQLHFKRQVRRLSAGRLYLLPASLSFSVDYRARSELRFFHVQVQDFAGLDIFRDSEDILEAEDSSALVRELFETFPGDGARRLRWQSALFQFICRAGAPLLAGLQPKQDLATRYAELLEHVRLHCNAGMSVGELARRFHQPRAAFSKGFQRCFGISLKQHLQALLIQRAKERLSASAGKIQAVAQELGFKDAYYFYRFFKRHTGKTPLRYRRLMSMDGA